MSDHSSSTGGLRPVSARKPPQGTECAQCFGTGRSRGGGACRYCQGTGRTRGLATAGSLLSATGGAIWRMVWSLAVLAVIVLMIVAVVQS